MCVRVCVCVIYTCPCDGVIYQNDTYLISHVFLQPPPSSLVYNTSNNNFFTHFHSFFISFFVQGAFRSRPQASWVRVGAALTPSFTTPSLPDRRTTFRLPSSSVVSGESSLVLLFFCLFISVRLSLCLC